MNYKTVDLKQGSEEWKNWRRFKITASDIAKVMNESPWGTPLSLFEEKIENKIPQETQGMRYGKEMESVALSIVNSHLGANYHPVCCLSTILPWLGASLDGFDGMQSIKLVECKVMNQEEHAKTRKGFIPVWYKWQLEGQMFVMGENKALFVSYKENDPAFVEYESDPSYREAMLSETKKFYEKLMNFESPEPTDKDYQQVSDSGLINLMCEYDQLEKAFKGTEKRMKDIKDALTGQLTRSGIKRALIGSKKVSNYLVKGRVDYDAIPALKEIDLEKYRKSPSSCWRFTTV